MCAKIFRAKRLLFRKAMLVYMIFGEKSNIFAKKLKFCGEKSRKKWLTFDRKYNIINNAIPNPVFCGHGGMADALGSGPSARKGMEVQVLLTAPKNPKIAQNVRFRGFFMVKEVIFRNDIVSKEREPSFEVLSWLIDRRSMRTGSRDSGRMNMDASGDRDAPRAGNREWNGGYRVPSW